MGSSPAGRAEALDASTQSGLLATRATPPPARPGAPHGGAAPTAPRRPHLLAGLVLLTVAGWTGLLGAQPAPSGMAVAPAVSSAAMPDASSTPPSGSGSATPADSAAPPEPTPPAPAEEPPPALAAPDPGAASPAPTDEAGAPAPEPEPAPEASAAPAEEPPPETYLALEGWGGVGARLDGPTDGFGDDETFGTGWGLGGAWAPDRAYTITLGVEDRRLGQESTPARFWPMRVDRGLTSLWLGLRSFPWRTEDETTGLFVSLGLGLSFERGEVSGLEPRLGATAPPRAYRCSVSDGPRLALGAGVGVERWLSRDLAFIGGVDVGAHQLSGDVLDVCAPSLGSTAILAARVALAWRFDLSDE